MVFGFDDAAGALLGGGISMLGGMMTNSANAAEAEKNRVFADQQATLGRNFSERMSNTAWQRGVTDMKKAGINPIAAFGAGGASTPGASTASAPGNPQMTNAMGVGISSAMQALSLKNDMRNTDADVLAKTSQALQAQASAAYTNASARQTNEQTADIVAGHDAVKAKNIREQGDDDWANRNRAARMLTTKAGIGGAIINSAKAVDKMLYDAAGENGIPDIGAQGNPGKETAKDYLNRTRKWDFDWTTGRRIQR